MVKREKETLAKQRRDEQELVDSILNSTAKSEAPRADEPEDFVKKVAQQQSMVREYSQKRFPALHKLTTGDVAEAETGHRLPELDRQPNGRRSDLLIDVD